MTLNIDATFEGKLTCAFKNDMRNLGTFHQSMFESLKMEICVITMKNDTKFKEKLTCQFKIGTRNLTNFDPSTRKSFNRLLLTKICNAWAKKSIEELCLMALKLMQNLKETCLCFLKI